MMPAFTQRMSRPEWGAILLRKPEILTLLKTEWQPTNPTLVPKFRVMSSASLRLTSLLHVEKEPERHLASVPPTNPKHWPFVFSTLPFCFCFFNLLVTLCFPHLFFFFGTMILTLSFPSPFLTWRDVQHVIVRTSRAGHLNANDWKTNAAGFKGENFFHILSQAKYFYFSPILNGEPEVESLKRNLKLCADTQRACSLSK